MSGNIVEYEPGADFGLPDAALMRALNGGCPKCGDYFKAGRFDEFYTDAGYGCAFHVTTRSGLCPRCFEEMKAARKPMRSLNPLVRSYERRTLGDDGTYREKVAYEEPERLYAEG